MRPLNISTYIYKRASTDPRLLAALQGALVGGAGGAVVQGIRKLMQSRREEEEEGSPSILKGMLVGGGLGAMGGAGLEHLMRTPEGGAPGPMMNPGMSGGGNPFTTAHSGGYGGAHPRSHSDAMRAMLPQGDAGDTRVPSQMGSLQGLGMPGHPALM